MATNHPFITAGKAPASPVHTRVRWRTFLMKQDEQQKTAESLTRIAQVCDRNVEEKTTMEKTQRKEKEDAKLANLSKRGRTPWWNEE